MCHDVRTTTALADQRDEKQKRYHPALVVVCMQGIIINHKFLLLILVDTVTRCNTERGLNIVAPELTAMSAVVGRIEVVLVSYELGLQKSSYIKLFYVNA